MSPLTVLIGLVNVKFNKHTVVGCFDAVKSVKIRELPNEKKKGEEDVDDFEAVSEVHFELLTSCHLISMLPISFI